LKLYSHGSNVSTERLSKFFNVSSRYRLGLVVLTSVSALYISFTGHNPDSRRCYLAIQSLITDSFLWGSMRSAIPATALLIVRLL